MNFSGSFLEAMEQVGRSQRVFRLPVGGAAKTELSGDHSQ